MRLPALLLFFCCFFTVLTNAQQLLFSSLGDKVQLPAQECYNIMQDHQGYIWFSTERGLCRYANNRLVVFDRKNGLPEESVYAVDQDPSGMIWFMTSKNRILKFAFGKLSEPAFSKAYGSLKAATGEVNPTPFFLDAGVFGSLYCSNRFYSASINTNTSEVRKLTPRKDAHFVFVKEKGRRLIAFTKVVFPKPAHAGNGEVIVRISEKGVNRFIRLPNTTISSLVYFQSQTCLLKNTDFFSIHDRLVKVNADFTTSIIAFPGRIVSLYADKDNGLWVGTLKNGVYYYPDISTMKLGQHNLSTYSVTGICEDHEKGIWCSTLEKGIFYSRNKYITGYPETKELTQRSAMLQSIGGTVFSALSAHSIVGFKNGLPEVHVLPFTGKITFTDMIRHNGKWMIFGSDIMAVLSDKFRLEKRLMLHSDYMASYAGCYQVTALKNGKLCGIIQDQVFVLENDKIVKTLRMPIIGRTILAFSDNKVLAGSSEDLHLLNVETGKYRKIAGVKGHITRMLRSRSGITWIATKTDGMYWLDANLKPMKLPFSMETSVFFDLVEDCNGTIWSGSAIGLVSFKPKGTTYTAHVVNTISGLPSNEIYKVAADSTTLYCSTFEGLFSFPLDHTPENASPPSVYLGSLFINEVPVKLTGKTIHVDHHRNSFRFLFDILTFKNGMDSKLICHIDGPEGKSLTRISGNELLLENLAPGSYTVKIWALNNDGVKSLHPLKFSMEIDSPYWFTWWFIALVIMLLVLLSLLLVRLVVRKIRKREEAKTAINKLVAEYQMTALQAQMNPHFIFNAINTIQGYILRRNEEEAYAYLAKFSKLIRMVLNNSQESTLSLYKELEMLNLYIELEQLRFDHCFDYELQLASGIDPHENYLPGMLLQPYIENAIWHGIINLERSRRGKLVVKIDKDENHLLITISDNGVGREMAKSFRKDISHQSMGMNLAEQRVMAMNRLKYFESARVTITDLHDESGAPAGTVIEIHLPVIRNYE